MKVNNGKVLKNKETHLGTETDHNRKKYLLKEIGQKVIKKYCFINF